MGCGSSLPAKEAAGGMTASQSLNDRQDAAAAAALLFAGGLEFTSLVELSISCRNLPNLDITSKSDPMAVLYQSGGFGKTNWAEQGRTDVLKNTQDPVFTKPLPLRYTFEQLQPMRVVIYDADTSAASPKDLDLSRQDYVGEAEFLLSDLMTAASQTLQLPLHSAAHGGRALPARCVVVLRAEELANTSASVRLAFSASGLDNKDRFGKSDPFLRVLKLREGGDWVPVLKTEVIDNNLNPAWRPIEVDIRQLCNADEHRPLKLEVLDYEGSGAHQFIGECQSSLGQLRSLAPSPSPTLDLVNPRKAGHAGYRNSGVLTLREVAVRPRPSFLQYISGGCQISFMVAIDFTASNGNPHNPSSLHFLSPAPTQYEQVIMAVGQVLERYDADRRFPVWGFGAGLPPSGNVSHCFSLAGNPAQPEVDGVGGILVAYRQCLPTIKLSGPTLFAPIINAAASIAQHAASGPGLGYFVLLILTDGCIMDMAATKQAIVEASTLPLSILIVGVGDADFDAMEALDSDKKALKAGGRAAARDIVQFVPLRETQRKGGAQAVAQELLAEIPGQVVSYFHGLKGIPPPPPAAAGAPPGQQAPHYPVV